MSTTAEDPRITDSVSGQVTDRMRKFEGVLESTPAMTPEYLGAIRAAGFHTVGVVATLVYPRPTGTSAAAAEVPRYLILEHAASHKNVAGALGPLGETSKWRLTGNSCLVEHLHDTLSRGLQEELDVDAGDLELRKIPDFAGFSFANPIPGGVDLVFSLVFVVGRPEHIPEEPANKEIYSTAFRRLDEIPGSAPLRSYTKRWIKELREHNERILPAIRVLETNRYGRHGDWRDVELNPTNE